MPPVSTMKKTQAIYGALGCDIETLPLLLSLSAIHSLARICICREKKARICERGARGREKAGGDRDSRVFRILFGGAASPNKNI